MRDLRGAVLVSPYRRIIESRATPVVLLAMFVAAELLFVRRASTWFDESYTLLLVGPHGYADIASRTAVDGHPPLWYWVLKPWLSIFGSNLIAARAQSILFMTAALALWYRLLATRLDRTIALVALVFLVVNPSVVHYGVDARMYPFAAVLVAGSTLLLTAARRRRAHWVGYWLLAVAMLYTHYFLAFVIAGQFLWLLLRRREQGLRVWAILAYGASIIAAFAPWLPIAASQTHDIVSGGFWIPPVSPGALLRYTFGTYLQHDDPDLVSGRVWPALVFTAAFGAALVRAGGARARALGLYWCIAAIPPLCLVLLSMPPLVPIYHPRYVLFGVPAIATLHAAGVLAMRPRIGALVAVVLVASMAWGDVTMFHQGYDRANTYHGMNLVKKMVAAPVDGERPWIVTFGQFELFDARATLTDRRVVIVRDSLPVRANTDAIYYDKPDWYVTSLSQVEGRHAWLLENKENPPVPLPDGWTAQVTHVAAGYRVRLVEIARPPAP